MPAPRPDLRLTRDNVGGGRRVLARALDDRLEAAAGAGRHRHGHDRLRAHAAAPRRPIAPRHSHRGDDHVGACRGHLVLRSSYFHRRCETSAPVRGVRCDAAGVRAGDVWNRIGYGRAATALIVLVSAIEHFGLGEYGDSVMPDAGRHAVRTIAPWLKDGGQLLGSVPFGSRR
jgi:hypothetical protein